MNVWTMSTGAQRASGELSRTLKMGGISIGGDGVGGG